MITTDVLTLADGRQLEYGFAGDPAKPTVLFHHGTPGSVTTFNVYKQLFDVDEFFLVFYSRAGWGKSSRHEGRSAASVVADVTAVLDHLGRDEYVSVGWSGGGPHTLACAALGAPRCRGAIAVAGVAPIDADFDWTEGMGPENIEEFEFAKAGGPAYEAHLTQNANELATVTVDTLIDTFGGLLSEGDKVAWSPLSVREDEVRDLHHCFTGGPHGFIDDDQAFMNPWGFDVSTISVPTFIWFGDEDLMVPPTHGEWLVTNIPGATRRRVAPEGHISIWFNQMDGIINDIRQLSK